MPYIVPNLDGKSEAECKKAVQEALQAGSERMCRMEKSLRENTELTSEVVEILRAAKGGLRTLGWIGAALKWGAGIAGAVYTIYCVITGKVPTP